MEKLLVTNLIALCITAAFLAAVYAGWDPNKTESAKDQKVSNTKVAEVISNFKNNYPNLKTYFEEAHGYAVSECVNGN